MIEEGDEAGVGLREIRIGWARISSLIRNGMYAKHCFHMFKPIMYWQSMKWSSDILKQSGQAKYPRWILWKRPSVSKAVIWRGRSDAYHTCVLCHAQQCTHTVYYNWNSLLRGQGEIYKKCWKLINMHFYMQKFWLFLITKLNVCSL